MVNSPGTNLPILPNNDSDKDKDSFSETLRRLEEIVLDLERGDLALEASLAKYEEGMVKLKKCYSILDGIERKISLITKKEDGSIQEVPFAPDNKTPRAPF